MLHEGWEMLLFCGVESNMIRMESFLSLYSANFKLFQMIQIVKLQIQIRLNF
jgi:hypothetical protein